MKKHILYIIPYPRFFSQISHMGGHVAHVCGVVEAFCDLDYEVDILAEEGSPSIQMLDANIDVYPLIGTGMVKRFFWGKSFVKKVEEKLKKKEYDLVYMRYSVGFACWMPLLKRVLGRIPLIVEVNSFLTQRRRQAKFLERYFMSAADHLLTISKTNYDQLTSMYKRLPFKLHLVPNGVNVSRFSDWKENMARSYKTPFVAAYAGIVKDWYGLNTLIEASDIVAGKNKDFVLKFYGDGPYLNELKSFSAGRPWVVFEGPKPFNEMPKILGSVDILLNSASAKNAFQSPTKVYEYMATGRPIISAKTEQTAKLLEERGCGLCYEIDNPQDLAEKIQQLIDHPDQGREYSLNARMLVESEYTWEKRMSSFLGDIQGVNT